MLAASYTIATSGVCSGKARAKPAPFVRLPGCERQVQPWNPVRNIHSPALPIEEIAAAVTTIGFLGDTPTEVFASAGLLLTAAGILIVEAVQANAKSVPSKSTAPTSDPIPAPAENISPAPTTTSMPSARENVVGAREWIKSWRSRQSEVQKPVVESFELSDAAIAESSQETASTPGSHAEARKQEVRDWISAFRQRSQSPAAVTDVVQQIDSQPAQAAQMPATTEQVPEPSNPLSSFFSWLRSLWLAIISLFKQDSGTKPQTA